MCVYTLPPAGVEKSCLQNGGSREPQEEGLRQGKGSDMSGSVCWKVSEALGEAGETCCVIQSFLRAGLGYPLEKRAGEPRLSHFSSQFLLVVGWNVTLFSFLIGS